MRFDSTFGTAILVTSNSILNTRETLEKQKLRGILHTIWLQEKTASVTDQRKCDD